MTDILLPTNPSRRHWLAGTAGACLATIAPGSSAAGTTTIRVSHVVARDTPKGLAMERFRSLVESQTDQRIQVQIYPQGRLYGDNDEMQALQLGAIDMVVPSLSKFGPIGFPEFELFDLPFLFDTTADVRRITHGSLGEKLFERLGRQRLLGLGYFGNGFKQMSAHRPLLEPADFVGVRMRIQASQVIAQQMRALGAYPVALPFSENKAALASGVVDGQENVLSNFWTQDLQTVQEHLSLTRHGYLGYAVVTHQRFWWTLPAADQTLLREALAQALDYGNSIADAQNERALNALRSAPLLSIHTPNDAQRQRLQRALAPVQTDLARRVGRQWVDTALETLGKK